MSIGFHVKTKGRWTELAIFAGDARERGPRRILHTTGIASNHQRDAQLRLREAAHLLGIREDRR